MAEMPQPSYNVTVVDDAHPNGIPLEQWQNKPVQEPVAWSGYDLDGMVEAFSRVIEAHHSSKHPFHDPINTDARMARARNPVTQRCNTPRHAQALRKRATNAAGRCRAEAIGDG
jgi:hypothetical protein